VGGILDFFIFTGPTPQDVIRQYTQVCKGGVGGAVVERMEQPPPPTQPVLYTEVNGTVAYPMAQNDNFATVCLGVPRFAAGALPIPLDPKLLLVWSSANGRLPEVGTSWRP